jgi:hypothetical protein
MVKINHNTVKRVVVGTDWGFTNPGVLSAWAVDGDGRMYLVHETYRTRRLIDWWTDRARAIHIRFGVEAFVCDPSEPAYIAQFRNAGLPVREAYNEILPGIQMVENRLKIAEDGRPRLFLCREALDERDEALVDAKKPTCTLEEFDSYVWPKGIDGKPTKEIPVDDNNHGLDALRYGVCYVDGKGRRSYDVF